MSVLWSIHQPQYSLKLASWDACTNILEISSVVETHCIASTDVLLRVLGTLVQKGCNAFDLQRLDLEGTDEVILNLLLPFHRDVCWVFQEIREKKIRERCSRRKYTGVYLNFSNSEPSCTWTYNVMVHRWAWWRHKVVVSFCRWSLCQQLQQTSNLVVNSNHKIYLSSSLTLSYRSGK